MTPSGVMNLTTSKGGVKCPVSDCFFCLPIVHFFSFGLGVGAELSIMPGWMSVYKSCRPTHLDDEQRRSHRSITHKGKQ